MVTQPHNGRLPTSPDPASHGGYIIDRATDPRLKYQPALAPITCERTSLLKPLPFDANRRAAS